MPAVVACPKCKKRFNLPDKLLGKTVKCTECATSFRTPPPQGTGTGQAPANAQAQQAQAKRQQAAAEAKRRAIELQKLGVDGPLQQAPDVFDGLASVRGTADPLNNVVLEDPGFADVNYTAEPEFVEESPNAGMFDNPALAAKDSGSKKMGGKKKKKRRGKNSGLKGQPWFLILAIFAPLCLLTLVLSLTGILSPQACFFISVVLMILLGLVSMALQVWQFILIQNEMNLTQALLSLFIPFYVLYPIIDRWSVMKDYVYAVLSLILVNALGAVSYTHLTLPTIYSV